MNKIVGLFAFCILFVAACSLTKNDHKHDDVISETTQELEEIVENDASDRTKSEKLHDASRNMVSDRLKNANKSQADDSDKEYSAGVFAGQYGRNVFALHEYCTSLGVNLSEFRDKYIKTHEQLYINANLILNSRGSSVDDLYSKIKHTTKDYVEKEIKDMRGILNKNSGQNIFTLADSCDYYNELSRDQSSMNSLQFSTSFPAAYEIIMNSN